MYRRGRNRWKQASIQSGRNRGRIKAAVILDLKQSGQLDWTERSLDDQSISKGHMSRPNQGRARLRVLVAHCRGLVAPLAPPEACLFVVTVSNSLSCTESASHLLTMVIMNLCVCYKCERVSVGLCFLGVSLCVLQVYFYKCLCV